jgi:glycosyltransferase involved in cell wall biosynthesis
MPMVSVVIPTRDRRALLVHAVASVLRQRDVDLEAIVVDDGSEDASSEAVRALGDARLRLVRHDRPRGVSTARNEGARIAGGRWLAFLDDDDLWSPDKLSLQIRAAEEAGVHWAYGGAVEIDADGRIVAGDPPPSPVALVSQLRSRNAMPAGCSNVVVRASEFRDVGGFDPGLRHLPDWDLWLRLAALGGPAIIGVPVVAYRIHPSQATMDTRGMLEEARILAARHRVDVRSIDRWIAWSHLRRGERGRALAAYVRAVRAGDVASLGRLAVAAVHPRPLVLGAHRDTAASRAWRRQAVAWVEEQAS